MSAAPGEHAEPDSSEIPDGIYDVLPPVERSPVEIWTPPPVIDRERICPACGYDMRGIDSPRCPECGNEYLESVLKQSEHAAMWSFLWTFRWVVIGVLPMFLWAIAAWFMLKYGGTYGRIGAFVSGIVCSLGLAAWTASQAYDENDELEGLFLAVAVMIAVGFLNFAALRVLLAL